MQPFPRHPPVNAEESVDSKENDPLINQRGGHFRIMETTRQRRDGRRLPCFGRIPPTLRRLRK